MNIALIGMPAVGKSTIGVVLAKVLGMEFLDTDILLQHTTGQKLRDIIALRGDDGFKKLEGEVIASLDVADTVIATGGSAVYSTTGMEHLRQTAIVVYLSASYPTLERRLGDLRERGVVLGDKTLSQLYHEREPLYRKYAHIVIDENISIEDTVEAIIEAIDKM